MDRYGYGPTDGRRSTTLQRSAEALVAYLKSRKAEHWIMFAAGLVIGALLG